MLNERIQEFFKKHNLYDKEAFHYLTRVYNETDFYNTERASCCICVYPKINNVTHKIEGVSLTLPYVYDEVTTFIAMQEIARGLYYYKNIGRKYKPLEEELFAKRVETLYLAEYGSPALDHYLSQPIASQTEESEAKEKFAADNSEALVDIDLADFRTVSRVSRMLLRQWKRENR